MKPMNVQKFLIAVVVAQGLFIAGMFFGQSTAQARNELNLPDPGARQLQMVDELKALNAKVDRLNTTLTSGELTVKVAEKNK